MARDRDDFDGSQVIETASMVLFWQPPGIYGQWTDSPFTLEGHTYACTEQFMMAEKARLFGDEEVRAKILASSSPREQPRDKIERVEHNCMRPTAPRAFESNHHPTGRGHLEPLLSDRGSGHVATQPLQASAVPSPDCGADVHVDPANLREALVR